MAVYRFRNLTTILLCAACIAMLPPGNAHAEVVTFDMLDVALFSSTPPATITATTGMQIPGGFDNSGAANQFHLSSLQFDIDGDFDPLGEDPSIYFDLQVRTATFVGGQIVFDGFDHVFTPGAEAGSYVVMKGPNSYLNLPFAAGDIIGDGLEEFVRDGLSPPGPPANQTFSVAIDEGGIVTQFVEGADNFLGFRLDTGDYGWVRVQYDSTTPGMLIFLDGAYDDTGAPIAAGSTSAELPGDFNHDDSVDAADYVVWREQGLDMEQYQLWTANFGRSIPGGLVAVAVPEPSAILLAALLIGFMNSMVRRRMK